MGSYYREDIETMPRKELDANVDERIQYTVKYAYENSPFYRKWFDQTGVNPSDVHDHEDLRELPIISGSVIREKTASRDKGVRI